MNINEAINFLKTNGDYFNPKRTEALEVVEKELNKIKALDILKDKVSIRMCYDDIDESVYGKLVLVKEPYSEYVDKQLTNIETKTLIDAGFKPNIS